MGTFKLVVVACPISVYLGSCCNENLHRDVHPLFHHTTASLGNYVYHVYHHQCDNCCRHRPLAYSDVAMPIRQRILATNKQLQQMLGDCFRKVGLLQVGDAKMIQADVACLTAHGATESDACHLSAEPWGPPGLPFLRENSATCITALKKCKVC